MSSVDVEKVVGESRFNRFHLMREWSLSPVEGGLIGSYGFFGMMLGAICFGVLADRFGRRNVLVVSVFLFSVFMFLCAFATGPVSFSLFRFVGGVGIGGILAPALALLMLPGLGWRSLYWVAILPVPFLPFMVRHFASRPRCCWPRDGRTSCARSWPASTPTPRSLPARCWRWTRGRAPAAFPWPSCSGTAARWPRS
ncbi:hypothetical protein GCM10009850_020960 [Nonomuraea monospora]|uniref:Major facilitator superfamily (MFS) profile domain-containing protein n=1 Tax=Nonomuraea monospora TaxID=568818 RepID=A0ABP5P4M1_9ACTN